MITNIILVVLTLVQIAAATVQLFRLRYDMRRDVEFDGANMLESPVAPDLGVAAVVDFNLKPTEKA